MGPIRYQNNLDGIEPRHLDGFFVGWPNPPSAETLVQILKRSYRFWLAIEADSGRVVGFINSVSDGILSAFIPLLEVLPDLKSQGIGTQLAKHMIADLKHLYSVDLLCDADLQAFYEQVGMQRATGMLMRNYGNQSGNRSES